MGLILLLMSIGVGRSSYHLSFLDQTATQIIFSPLAQQLIAASRSRTEAAATQRSIPSFLCLPQPKQITLKSLHIFGHFFIMNQARAGSRGKAHWRLPQNILLLFLRAQSGLWGDRERAATSVPVMCKGRLARG